MPGDHHPARMLSPEYRRIRSNGPLSHKYWQDSGPLRFCFPTVTGGNQKDNIGQPNSCPAITAAIQGSGGQKVVRAFVIYNDCCSRETGEQRVLCKKSTRAQMMRYATHVRAAREETCILFLDEPRAYCCHTLFAG